jgi:hypothetical protein
MGIFARRGFYHKDNSILAETFSANTGQIQSF